MKNQKTLYEPPKFRDLIEFNVIGQVTPQGMCQAGHSPIGFTCEAGPNPTQPDSCSPVGTLPTYGRCSQGGSAVEGCVAGSSVNQCVAGLSFS